MRYASGRDAWGECSRCGLFFRLNELIEDGYKKNFRVCQSCYDPFPPQERIVSVDDPQALWKPALEHPPDGEGIAAPDFAGVSCPIMGEYNVVDLAVVDCMVVRD